MSPDQKLTAFFAAYGHLLLGLALCVIALAVLAALYFNRDRP